jgi:hypothetical protein
MPRWEITTSEPSINEEEVTNSISTAKNVAFMNYDVRNVGLTTFYVSFSKKSVEFFILALSFLYFNSLCAL